MPLILLPLGLAGGGGGGAGGGCGSRSQMPPREGGVGCDLVKLPVYCRATQKHHSITLTITPTARKEPAENPSRHTQNMQTEDGSPVGFSTSLYRQLCVQWGFHIWIKAEGMTSYRLYLQQSPPCQHHAGALKQLPDSISAHYFPELLKSRFHFPDICVLLICLPMCSLPLSAEAHNSVSVWIWVPACVCAHTL